jgi:ribosomal-protein-alanine N-acetyltransferase
MITKNTIETERLLLREWENQDLETFANINRDPKVMEFMPGLLTLEETSNWMNKIKQHFVKYRYGYWAVTLKNSDELIGYTGLNVPSYETHFTPCVEISWRIASKHWGKGVATEAARAVLTNGFEKYGLKEIVSLTVPANKRSIRVMEKIGMKRDLSGDFNHPILPKEHPLSKHILYRISKS